MENHKGISLFKNTCQGSLENYKGISFFKDTGWDSLENHRGINRGSYISAHVLLNLLNELGKRDKMRGLLSKIISFSQRV